MRINITYDSSVTALKTSNPTLYANYTAAVTTAVNFYENLIATPITVSLSFGWGEVNGSLIGSGALAESEHYTANYTWSQLYAALEAADTTSATQKAAAALLASENTADGAAFAKDTFVLATPEAAALGLNTGSAPIAGFVGMNSAQNWAWTETSVGAGQYDAVSALEHEISEDLGREATAGAPGDDTLDPLNLFAFTPASGGATTPGAAAGTLDLSLGQTQGYFSYNGTAITLPFGSPADIANGDDVGDWTETVKGDSYGFGFAGMASPVSTTDLQVMNALGFDFVGPTIAITGAVAGQAIVDKQTVAPFSAVAISDSQAGQTLTLSVAPSHSADGALSNLDGGDYNTTTGIFTLTGAAPLLTAALEGLIFTPSIAAGATATIQFTLSVSDGSDPTVTDSTTSVTVTSVSGGGQTVAFTGSPGRAASLYNTGGDWDSVSGSNGAVYLASAQVSVFGGDDSVHFSAGSGNAASLYNTAGAWDGVDGAGGTIYLTSAQASITGGGETIYFSGGSGDAASLYATSGNWDAVSATSGTIYLTSAQASISGGGDVIYFSGGSGNAASLYATSAWDLVSGSNGAVYLTSAQASVVGGDDTITFAGGSNNAVSLYGASGQWDVVSGGNGLVYLTNSRASVFGSLNTIDFAGGSGNAVSLYATNGSWDTVNGSSGTVYLTSSQTSVVGGGDVINFHGGTGNVASLAQTGGSSDTVIGSGGTVNLYGAQAAVNGSSDTIGFNNSSSLTLGAGSELLTFSAGLGGLDTIAGFATNDTIQVSKSDFANFAALSSHLTQSGANAVITRDAADTITLTGVTASTLTAAEFAFA
jgi:hypothetical protein